MVKDGSGILRHHHRQLAPTGLGIGRCKDRGPVPRRRAQAGFQRAGEREGLAPEGGHPGLVKELQGGEQRRHRQDRRVAGGPPLRTWPGNKVRVQVHAEARGRVVPPPPREAREVPVVAVPLVHEGRRDRARTSVQILVGAPDGEVHVPVMQRQGHVAGSMREVEPRPGTGSMRRRRDALDVQPLAREVLHAWQHHQGHRLTLIRQEPLDVLGTKQIFPGARPELNHHLGGIEAPGLDVALHGIGVGREGVRLDDDAGPARHGLPEGGQHQVQVDGEGVHHHHLARRGADHARHRLAKLVVVGVPRVAA